ncbi:MAG: glycerate kinase [Candidatus Geothermarchaeales archaeon]
MFVRNKRELLAHGNRKGRRIALDIIEHALRAVDPYSAVKRLVKITNDVLSVGNLKIDLSQVGNIYAVGAGKATLPVAHALQEILGERLTKGVIIVKHGQKATLNRIQVIEGGHPIPDTSGLRGARKILKLVKTGERGDLLFSLMTGGCSALMPLPIEGVTLPDKRRVTELLLRSGANIQEINAVRKHISAVKGGRLARHFRGKMLVNLTVSDVIGDPLDYITGPTVPDTSTFVDAISSLTRHGLWDRAPASITRHLGRSDPQMESPKSFPGLKYRTFVLTNNIDACHAAEKRARELGLNAQILSTMMEGESVDMGIVMSGIAKEISKYNNPVEKPCAVITSGETTVTMRGKAGQGGPNQEFALGFATKLTGIENAALVAIGTDGTDGPTGIAGGIADDQTLQRAAEMGIDLFQSLRNHSSSQALKRLRDAVITGHTGTNVMDLRVMIIGA